MKGKANQCTKYNRLVKSWLWILLLLLSSLCTYSCAAELVMKVDETSLVRGNDSAGRLNMVNKDLPPKYLRGLSEKEDVYSTEKMENVENTNSQKRTATGGVIRKVTVPKISQDLFCLSFALFLFSYLFALSLCLLHRF